MDYATVSRNYCNAVLESDGDAAMRVIEGALADGLAPEKLVFDVVLPALNQMLHKIVADDQATLSQHFITAKVSGEVVEKLISRFRTLPSSSGVVVMGTAFGDFHGLGRKIVSGCLRANMFTVHDAGLNASPARFVDLAEETGAMVIGVSSMMMHTTVGDEGPKGVRAELHRRGLENKIRLVVGGAPYLFDSALYRKVGADGWAADAFSAVTTIGALCESGVPHA